MKYTILLLAALSLISAAPLPAAALPPARIALQSACARATVPSSSPPAFTVRGTLMGPYRSGIVGPLGIYEGYGDTLAQATINAECEAEKIRASATAQAQP